MKHNNKPNPLKFFNDNRAAAYKKAGGAIAEYKKSLKRFQGDVGGSQVSSTTPTTTGQTDEQKKAADAARAKELAAMSGKQFRQEKRGIKRAQKLDRIASGKQGERVDNIIKAVGSSAEAVGKVAGAVKSTREAFEPRQQKKGGSVRSKVALTKAKYGIGMSNKPNNMLINKLRYPPKKTETLTDTKKIHQEMLNEQATKFGTKPTKIISAKQAERQGIYHKKGGPVRSKKR